MAERKTEFVEGEFYHLYNRGNSKQIIFLDDNDKDRFIKLLYLCNSNKSFNFRDDIVEKNIDALDFKKNKDIVSIGAWVLMPNHFHLLLNISPTSEVGEDSISVFMRKLCLAYSKYFNKKYERVGGLFESNFKATHVSSDIYLKYIFSYIHLNPVKMIFPKWKENGLKDNKKALEFLNKYKWSSYPDFRGKKRLENKIISREDFPDYFLDQKVFDDEIFEWLTFTPTSDVGVNNGDEI